MTQRQTTIQDALTDWFHAKMEAHQFPNSSLSAKREIEAGEVLAVLLAPEVSHSAYKAHELTDGFGIWPTTEVGNEDSLFGRSCVAHCKDKAQADNLLKILNERAALVAVAKAAKAFSYIVSNPNEKLRFQSDAQIDLNRAIADLEAVRAGKAQQ